MKEEACRGSAATCVRLCPGADRSGQAVESRGTVEDVLGRRLFVHRSAGSENPLLLFLHGFPSSSLNWRELFELRPGAEGTLAFDCLGFGLSEKPRDHLYTLACRPTPPRSWCAAPARRRCSSSAMT